MTIRLPGNTWQRCEFWPVPAIAVMMLTASSCSYGPAPAYGPSISASSAGDLAMEQYDTDGDSKVAGEELANAPGLNAALKRLDTNSDGGVSADEVAERVGQWKRSAIGVMSFGFTVTLNGSPLPEAIVTFEPEAFLGQEIKSASCTTNVYGGGSATIAKEERPELTSPPGMHLGLYKVKISKIVGGKETISAKYNEATILGQEVSQDVSEIANNRVVYALSTK